MASEAPQRGHGCRAPRLAASVVLLLLTLAAPPADGHANHDEAQDQLVTEGERLMVGSYDAPQAGPLVIVPLVEGALGCRAEDASPFRLPIGAGGRAGVTVRANATHVEAAFDIPDPGFVAFALDTATASRTLLMMQEHEVARHRLVADVVTWGGVAAQGESDGLREPVETPRSGVLGLPYQVEGAAQHDLGDLEGHGLEGGGVAMAFDKRPQGAVSRCDGDGDGHLALRIERDLLGATLAPGNVVHAVVLYDATLLDWLPRPLETTEVLQANLYLARPGEDPEALRAAFEPGATATDVIPLTLLAAGLLAVVVPALRARP